MGAKEQVYVVRTREDGVSEVQFGDGRTGAPVPTGSGNVQATYRVGAGVAGRVRSGTLTSALDRPPALKDVTNPLAARGGADPESPDAARENAPTTVRTFGRAVSLRDFSDLARSSGEIAKADATWVWDGYARAIHLTVAAQRGGVFAREDLRRLGASLGRARDPNYRLRLANFVPLPVVLRGTIVVDDRYVRSAVLGAVRAAALGALDFDSVDLGEPVHLSDLYRVIHDVEGVVAADLDELQAKRPADRHRPNAVLLPDGTPAPLQPHVLVFRAHPDPTAIGLVLPSELATVEDVARDVVLAADGGIVG
jgi:predicted phage baseplate assembly protein